MNSGGISLPSESAAGEKKSGHCHKHNQSLLFSLILCPPCRSPNPTIFCLNSLIFGQNSLKSTNFEQNSLKSANLADPPTLSFMKPRFALNSLCFTKFSGIKPYGGAVEEGDAQGVVLAAVDDARRVGGDQGAGDAEVLLAAEQAVKRELVEVAITRIVERYTQKTATGTNKDHQSKLVDRFVHDLESKS